MPKGHTLKVVFKENHQHQGTLIPLDLNDLIAAHHPVRTISAVLDKVDMSAIIKKYRPGGTSCYHPRMLLKAVVYAYINNLYSSRKIEEALCQNIHFMWLAGLQQPDHNTINRFRGERLQETLKPIFNQVVVMLYEEGVLDIKDLYTDGTKMEANANRYSFVWGKSIHTNRTRIHEKLNELWKYALTVAGSELDDTDPSGFTPIDKEKIKETIERINAALKNKEVTSEVRQKLKTATKNWPGLLDKYDEQEKIIGKGRNSYSKTDHDATFMRMKDDHMGNGQLKAGYNVQISTNEQYIATYSVHQNPADTNTLPEHVAGFIADFHTTPDSITADAGYGSEENYQLLEAQEVVAFVKHNQFDANQKKTTPPQDVYDRNNFTYNEHHDTCTCPAGNAMVRTGSHENTTANGYVQTLTSYKTTVCSGCAFQEMCNPSKDERIFNVNHNLRRLRDQADQRLTSREGIGKRKQRCHDVETVFANIKQNHHFRRFMLRGLEKVTIETGLLALAHNLRKKAA
jgi:transposase